MSDGDVVLSSSSVTVHVIFEPPHRFVEMHHYGVDPDGGLVHYCPTGFAMCDAEHDRTCSEIRPFDSDCHLWGATTDGTP